MIIIAALRSTGIDQPKIAAVIAFAEDKISPAPGNLPLLITQAEAARLISASRFTIRKMVAEGKLNQVELMPGLIRYR